jgi:hypothetical protein
VGLVECTRWVLLAEGRVLLVVIALEGDNVLLLLLLTS